MQMFPAPVLLRCMGLGSPEHRLTRMHGRWDMPRTPPCPVSPAHASGVPFSQCLPLKPWGHSQVYESSWASQDPPFRQGSESQGDGTAEKPQMGPNS